ncbi:hypothetical protein MTP99_004700 [Tenebrio molitor]|nr:hypothetical protein MTP99_004700 [Tenebrio molitor]
MEELEAMAGLLDVLDEFPECGTDYNSEMIGVRHYLGGSRITDQPPAAIIFIFFERDETRNPHPIRRMTQGQLELENREIPHAAAARARGE